MKRYDSHVVDVAMSDLAKVIATWASGNRFHKLIPHICSLEAFIGLLLVTMPPRQELHDLKESSQELSRLCERQSVLLGDLARLNVEIEGEQ